MAPDRGTLILMRACRAPVRSIHTTSPLLSGHNRWSKIKHDKGKNDAAKNKQRSIFAQEISTASKLYGPEPGMNPRLAFLITKAKREGFSKTSIEAAIARGQGRGADGTSLEAITVEAIMPGNIGLIVECETESKLRTLMDVKVAIKNAGGAATPSNYLFEKKGRVVFEEKEDTTSIEALDAALEAGATDVDDLDDGKIVVFTEPENTQAAGDAISKALDLQISTSGIVWDPVADTLAGLPSEEAAQNLCDFIDELQEKESSVQALAMNVSQGAATDDTWRSLQDRLT